jgi:hypothetical protein
MIQERHPDIQSPLPGIIFEMSSEGSENMSSEGSENSCPQLQQQMSVQLRYFCFIEIEFSILCFFCVPAI